jgi:hypothetical protein
MDTKKFGVNRRNSMVGQTYAHPPSFKDQANKHAFKISIAQKIKNFFRIKLSLQYIKEYNSSNRSISHVEQAYKIKTLTNDKSIPNNKSSTIIAKIEKKLIAMLKKKNFSNFQAKSIHMEVQNAGFMSSSI